MRAHFALPHRHHLSSSTPISSARCRMPCVAHRPDASTPEWGQGLIRSWNDARWIDLPEPSGRGIAPADWAPGRGRSRRRFPLGQSVQTASAALGPAARSGPGHRLERGISPPISTLAQGADQQLDRRASPGLVAGGTSQWRFPPRCGDDTALLMLTHVDYRSGPCTTWRRLPIRLTGSAPSRCGISPTAPGAVPLDLAGADVGFRRGPCGYKYLNGGPGRAGFLPCCRAPCGCLRAAARGAGSDHEAPLRLRAAYRPAPGCRALSVRARRPVLAMGRRSMLRSNSGRMVDLDALRAKSLAPHRCLHRHDGGARVPIWGWN